MSTTVTGGEAGIQKDTATAIQKDTATAEADANTAASILTAFNPAIGALATAGLQTAEGVANAVESNTQHETAVATIGAGVTALANSPLVLASPQAAAITGVAASFFSWLKSEFSKL